MAVYSLMLGLGVVASLPWWGWRLLRDGRLRRGLAGRLGRLPAAVLPAAGLAGARTRRVVWVQAVSVGEVLAAARMVAELGECLGPEWVVLVSTTTVTGQQLARERFGAERVFAMPLDFGWAVRRVLRALRPEMLVLVESEVWPRLLWECRRAGVPVAVVNARMSDRSYRRALRVRGLWSPVLRGMTLWLAQGEETAGRLRGLGVEADRVRVPGNLKFDLRDVGENEVAGWVRRMAAGRQVVVAGSTLPGAEATEERLVMQAWRGALRQTEVLLVLAPRHPERFGEVRALASAFAMAAASEWKAGRAVRDVQPEVVVLDTIGDLAAVYGVADVAFVGGSLVPRGGHNPLEAARWGVPVVMGPSYENFREVVEGMLAAEAVRVVQPQELEQALTELLRDDGGMGERGRAHFANQAGATARVVEALCEVARD